MAEDENMKDQVFGRVEAPLDKDWAHRAGSNLASTLEYIESFGVEIAFRRGQHVICGTLAQIQKVSQYLSTLNPLVRDTNALNLARDSDPHAFQSLPGRSGTKEEATAPRRFADDAFVQGKVLSGGGAGRRNYDGGNYGDYDDDTRHVGGAVWYGSGYTESDRRNFCAEHSGRNSGLSQYATSGQTTTGHNLKQEMASDQRDLRAASGTDTSTKSSSGRNFIKGDAPEHKEEIAKDGASEVLKKEDPAQPSPANLRELVMDCDIWDYITLKMSAQLDEVKSFGGQIDATLVDHSGTVCVRVTSPESDGDDVVGLVSDSLSQLYSAVYTWIVTEHIDMQLIDEEVVKVAQNYVEGHYQAVLLKQCTAHRSMRFIGPHADVSPAMLEFRRALHEAARLKLEEHNRQMAAGDTELVEKVEWISAKEKRIEKVKELQASLRDLQIGGGGEYDARGDGSVSGGNEQELKEKIEKIKEIRASMRELGMEEGGGEYDARGDGSAWGRYDRRRGHRVRGTDDWRGSNVDRRAYGGRGAGGNQDMGRSYYDVGGDIYSGGSHNVKPIHNVREDRNVGVATGWSTRQPDQPYYERLVDAVDSFHGSNRSQGQDFRETNIRSAGDQGSVDRSYFDDGSRREITERGQDWDAEKKIDSLAECEVEREKKVLNRVDRGKEEALATTKNDEVTPENALRDSVSAGKDGQKDVEDRSDGEVLAKTTRTNALASTEKSLSAKENTKCPDKKASNESAVPLARADNIGVIEKQSDETGQDDHDAEDVDAKAERYGGLGRDGGFSHQVCDEGDIHAKSAEDAILPALEGLTENFEADVARAENFTGVESSQPICQPAGGQFSWIKDSGVHLAGYGTASTIFVTVEFPLTTQVMDEPAGERAFEGMKFKAYLADTSDGREVMELMEKAFNQKRLFRIKYEKEGAMGLIVPNGVEFKTDLHDAEDACYLERVYNQLKKLVAE